MYVFKIYIILSWNLLFIQICFATFDIYQRTQKKENHFKYFIMHIMFNMLKFDLAFCIKDEWNNMHNSIIIKINPFTRFFNLNIRFIIIIINFPCVFKNLLIIYHHKYRYTKGLHFNNNTNELLLIADKIQINFNWFCFTDDY